MNSLQKYAFPTIPPNKTQKNLHTFSDNTILSLYQIQKGDAAKLVLQHLHSCVIMKSGGTICLPSRDESGERVRHSVRVWQHLEDERQQGAPGCE